MVQFGCADVLREVGLYELCIAAFCNVAPQSLVLLLLFILLIDPALLFRIEFLLWYPVITAVLFIILVVAEGVARVVLLFGLVDFSKHKNLALQYDEEFRADVPLPYNSSAFGQEVLDEFSHQTLHQLRRDLRLNFLEEFNRVEGLLQNLQVLLEPGCARFPQNVYDDLEFY